MRTWLLMGALLSGAAAPVALAAKMPAKKAVPKKAPKPAPKAAVKPVAPAAAKPAEPHAINLGGVAGAVPGEWTKVAPIGQFRLEQFLLPRAKGDTADASFIIFHFGQGGGGTVADNMRRWIGMMRQPEGTDVSQVAKAEKIEREGLRINVLDLPGTYLERPFPMSDQFTARPNYRMLAAIIETTKEGADGPYYFRIVGPARSIEAAKPGWDKLLASLKFD